MLHEHTPFEHCVVKISVLHCQTCQNTFCYSEISTSALFIQQELRFHRGRRNGKWKWTKPRNEDRETWH